jgi:serine/threonine protein kinase
VSTNTIIKFSRGDVISRKYEIEEHLGDGLFGVSFRAKHITSGRHLVIKFLRPELFPSIGEMNAFRQAFEKAKAVRHPGLIRYGEINQHNKLPYFTQEYYKSQSLRGLMDEYSAQGRNVSLAEACQLTVRALTAIQAAHDAEITHSNLKPENLLIQTAKTGPGQNQVVRQIKLTDAGLSGTLEGIKSIVEFDSRPDFVYQAPEQAAFGKGGDVTVDVYSMGVILYEMLCGRAPGTPFQYPTEIRPDLPEHINQVIELALAPNPEDRYQTAHDMAHDVQRSLQSEMLSQQKPTSFRNIVFGLTGVLGIVLAVAAYYASKGPTDQTHNAELADRQIRSSISVRNGDADISEEVRNAEPGMVYIPSGWYLSGRMEQENSSLASPSEPLHGQIELPAFYIDRYEHGNTAGQVPVTSVTYSEAAEACELQGKQLCTTNQWEKACKGPNNFIYSYGDAFDPEMCGEDIHAPYTSGSRAFCHSGYGIYDMSGGFMEWTASAPEGLDSRRYVMGGTRADGSATASQSSRHRVERGYRCAYSTDQSIGYSHQTLSFRCCKAADESGN